MSCYVIFGQNEGAFIEAALLELPTRTESEVKAHSAWYTEYSTLLEAKRLAIQQWKKSRQVHLYKDTPELRTLLRTPLRSTTLACFRNEDNPLVCRNDTFFCPAPLVSGLEGYCTMLTTNLLKGL